MTNCDKWDYSKATDYGDDASYLKVCSYLDENVEDWGCGAKYAKKFLKGYKGIDGSGNPDVKADLEVYTSRTPNLLMRHILEHNHQWQKVLDNALSSFTKKMSLVIFTPFSETTRLISTEPNGIPNLSFRKLDLENEFRRFNCIWTEETFSSKTQYGQETVFYLKK